MRLLPLSLAVVLLTGCSILPIQEQKKEPQSLTESLQQAKHLRREKRYSEAGQLLTQVKKNHPDNPEPAVLLEQILAEQQRHRQLIEDKLLATRLTLIQQQRPLLAQLANNQPDDVMLRSRLQQLDKTWQESRPLLSRCGKRQLKHAPATAEKCLRLALAIEEQKVDRKRLTQIERNRARSAKKAQQKKSAARIQQLLKQARHKQASGEHYSALMLLKQLLELAPESTRAIHLKREIQEKLENHTQHLLTAGETLYQRGELEGAIAIWKTLLLLNPQHKQALQKAERAQRVLNNLQQLRHQQKPGTKN
ncbi:MAG: hypothetical protein L3J26_10715 [Candidatus Polarisedimenticolaceae bacterium]|nr:hypothetical protein [Candidatus Polarisedimenticolaceae bacterium]